MGNLLWEPVAEGSQLVVKQLEYFLLDIREHIILSLKPPKTPIKKKRNMQIMISEMKEGHLY